MTGTRVLLCCVVGLMLPGLSRAADWPQWGGTEARNMISPEKNLPATFVPIRSTTDPAIQPGTPTNVRWVASLGGASYGNPTVAGGRVFIGTDDKNVDEDPRFTRTQGGLLKCFDEKTGKLLWQLVVPKRTGYPKDMLYGQQHLGVCSSPLVDGDRVYVVTCACEVLCLDVHGQANGNDGQYKDEASYEVSAGASPVKLGASDADIIWRYDLMKDLGVWPHDVPSCSILVHGDVLYLSTCNGVDKPHAKVMAPNVPAFIAMDKRTGRLLGYEAEGISSRLWHCQWCSPSCAKVGDKTLILLGGGDGFCYAFEALESTPEKPVAMKKVWSYDCDPPEYRLKDGETIPYMKGDKRKKDTWNRNDGTYLGPSEIIGTPVCVNGRVYTAIGQDPAHGRGRGLLHCIDATKTGDITKTGRIWTYDGLDRTIATPTIAGGLVYVPDIAGRLHCVDADSGKPCWVYETHAETWGSVLVADDRLYFGTMKSFYVMATGREAKVLSDIPLGSPMQNSPIVANGAIFIAAQRYMWSVAKP